MMLEEHIKALNVQDGAAHSPKAEFSRRESDGRFTSSEALQNMPKAVSSSKHFELSLEKPNESQDDALDSSARRSALRHRRSSFMESKDAGTLVKSSSQNVLSLLNQSDVLHREMQARLANRRRGSMAIGSAVPKPLPEKITSSAAASIVELRRQSQPTDPVRRATLRRLWHVAYVGYIMAHRLIKLDRRLIPTLVRFSVESNLDTDALLMLIKNYVPKRDLALSKRVVEFVNSERSDLQCDKMAQLLAIRLHSFSSYSQPQQRMFCKSMNYEIYTQGKLIVKQNHCPSGFYFILSGQVDMFTVRDDVKYRLSTGKAGDSFGDRCIRMVEGRLIETPRMSSVSTMTETELLRIEKGRHACRLSKPFQTSLTDFAGDFLKIISLSGQAQRENNIQLLLGLPHFCSDRSIVEKIVSHAKFATYQPNQVIISEGSVALDMYWVISGSCRSDKMMRIVRRKNAKGKDIVKLSVADDAATQSEGDEKPTYEMMSLFEFQPGDFFPGMTPAPGLSTSDPESSKREYVAQLRRDDEAGRGPASQYTVVTSSNTTLMLISQHNFALFAGFDMLQRALDDGHFKITPNEIVAAFEQRARWDEFRREQTQQMRK
ncbi:hypothetical protein HK105_202881 [Polyrhizophydium stewartii]|uniref:Cyclic nucleotide-binding domain-containing protein n=1 Tax=Polyrhizophydium stewartii TaxID=2732419 RepID=A0ABR4NDK6_9FUNG